MIKVVRSTCCQVEQKLLADMRQANVKIIADNAFKFYQPTDPYSTVAVDAGC